jgi:hypothetical protein
MSTSQYSNSLTNTLFDRPLCLTKEDECDIYIAEFVHDATENYYERGKYGCWNSHVTKTPLFILKVLKLLLFYLPILVTMCFFDLFSYKIPMHRKWVRLKCVLYLLLDALFCFNSYFLCEHLSWEFGDSSHGDGLTEGLDGVRRWVWLRIVQLRHLGLPRFRPLHAGGNTPTSCLVSY